MTVNFDVLQAEESELNGQLQAAQAGVHAALCDNIDTARALIQLSDLVTSVNKYLAKRPLPHGAPPDGALALSFCCIPLHP